MAHGKKIAQDRRRSTRAQTVDRKGRGFLSGFLMGLGAVTLLGPAEFNPPRHTGDGVKNSWRAVGDSMRIAMRRVHEDA